MNGNQDESGHLIDEASKTPRTDAELKLEAFFDGIGIVETVEVEFAQELEAELADARAEIERLKKLQQFATAINCAMIEADFDPEYLRGHECVAKHKLLSMFDLWRKKVKPRLPGFIDDEISKRDKLIKSALDAAEMLWVVLANVDGGDWSKQTPEWQTAAEQWRDNYLKIVSDKVAAERNK